MSISAVFRARSLGTKLISATMLVLVVVTAAVYTSLTAWQRANVLRAKETAAMMVSRLFEANVQAPLTFDDDKGVAESVATLSANEDVAYGAVWSVADGKLGARLGELRRSADSFSEPSGVPQAVMVTRTSEWVIVDEPVADPTGKVVGVSRIAFSLARENAAIAAMARRTLWWSLAIAVVLGALLAVVTRLFITRPLGRLAGAVRRLEAGERVDVKIESRDEVGRLAGAFSKMSAAIVAREQRIVERNRDMRLVLDNVEDGFLSVDREGRMSDERSAILDRWFGAPGEGDTLFAYLARVAPKTAQWLQFGWDSILEDFMPLDVSIEQLPKRFGHDGNHYELRYRPLLRGDVFDGMLVVVSDVTLRVESERAEAAQREMLAVFRRMLADRASFGEFLEECGAIVDTIAAYDGGDLVTLRRAIHTLKGNTALYGVESLTRACHELETRMIEGGDAPSSLELQTIRSLWRAFLRRCEELGWNAATAGVHLEPAELDELVAAVKSGERGPRLLEIVGSWSREPARTRLARLGEQVTSLAKRLGKPSPLIEIAPTKLRLPTKKWAPLLTSLAHVVRNVVDHGLESEDERRAAGKPMPPRVRFSLHADAKGAVVLSIADDGRGIAWEKIRERARALGLPHETQADLEEALYADRVSSMQEATETSGRGVGMGAVRAAVQACGGTLHVASAPGVGTTFRFVLPAFMLLDDERSHDERNSVPPRSGKQSLRWAAEVSS